MDFVIIILIFLATTLFFISRSQLKAVIQKKDRQENMKKMIERTNAYMNQGLETEAIIKKLKHDFTLDDQAAKYLIKKVNRMKGCKYDTY